MCVPVASLIGGETADHSVGSIVGLRHLTTVPSATFRQVGREALQGDMDVRRGDVRGRAPAVHGGRTGRCQGRRQNVPLG